MVYNLRNCAYHEDLAKEKRVEMDRQVYQPYRLAADEIAAVAQ